MERTATKEASDIEAHVISMVRENLPKSLAELVVNSDLVPLTQLQP